MKQKNETISKADLARLLQLSLATINRYIKANLLPSPIADTQTLFSRASVAESIGVNNLDEPFIMADEAARLLGISATQVRSLCQTKHMPLPHYKFINHRGCAYFFRVSEIKNFQSMSLVKSHQGQVYQEKRQLLNQVFSQLVDLSLTCDSLSAKQAELLKACVIEDKTLTEMATKNNFCHENARQYLIKGKTNLLHWLGQLKIYVTELVDKNKALERDNQKLRQLIGQLKKNAVATKC